MYASYFGLKQEPFSIAPDPRLLFMSERHREALAHLLYGVQAGGGFVLLTGEIGTGKTTVCRSFLEQVPAHVNLAYVFNPKLTVLELLETVCHEFGVPAPGRHPASVKDHLDPLNAFLLQAHAAGRHNVLVIDEAQNLAPELLEQLRLLTNLETNERKLLQIVLIGQPELRTMLARPELEQLAQRVVARYHLQALTAPETALYVRHRMEVCGLQGPLPFERRALARVHALTGGVPRRVNLLCDRALLGAFASGQPAVTRGIVERAAAEVFPRAPQVAPAWRRPALAGGLGAAAGAALVAGLVQLPSGGAGPAPQPMVAGLTAAVAAPAPPAALAAVASAPPVPAPTPRLLHDEQAAWRELATHWSVTLPPQPDACDALAREQVMCFRGNLSLAFIRQLDRPGIVTLDARTGQPSYAVLTALTDEAATLRAAGTEQTVTLAALAERWQGEFGTLWRAAGDFPMRVGDREGGPAVEWMAARLASLKGAAPPRGRPVLDAALKAEVRAFQRAQGLPADGRPGPLTYMQLNRASGVDEPRLRTDS